MGLFGRLFGKKDEAPPASSQEEAAAEEPEEPPVAVVVVREGMSPPSEEDMAAFLAREAPDHAALPRRGLSQPRWWRQDDWLTAGLRGVAAAYEAELAVAPDKATWSLHRDDRGARVALVFLRR